MLIPYDPPFIYVPIYYCQTTPPPPPPFQPCVQAPYYFQPWSKELPPSLFSCPPVYYHLSPYSPAGAHCDSHPHLSYFGHNAGYTINTKKAPEVGRRQFTRKKKCVPIRRFAGGGCGRSKPMMRSLEFDESLCGGEWRTTVMIRNIPNKFSRMALMGMLDGHCVAQNLTAEGSDSVSAYDFLYLPIDFKTGCNKGYAFVNLTTPAAAQSLYQSLKGYKWTFLGSSKITHVCYARIQGKAALTEHFTRSMFECNTEDFLPVVLSPPRDGSASLPAPFVLGRRVGFY